MRGGRRKEYWIAGAIRRPGALRAAARRAGAINKRGVISLEWLRAAAKKAGKLGRRARLALTLRRLRRRRT